MAARAKTLLLLLAALCLPAFAHVPRPSLVAQKPHQGVERFAQPSHRGPGDANALTAPGLPGCLYDKGRRSRSTAKERDDESGLDYFGARYFGSSLGRFTSPDAPFADQSPGAPQSWNLYGYVRNNPLRAVDLDGQATVDLGETGRQMAQERQRLEQQATSAPTLFGRLSARAQLALSNPINDITPTGFAVGAAVQGTGKFANVASTFAGGKFREITVKAGTQLKRAFEAGKNSPIGSFLTRGKTAEKLTSTGNAVKELALDGTSGMRPNQVATIEAVEDVPAAIGFIDNGGQQAVQVVVHPDDLVKLKEVEELRRTIE